MPSQFKSLTNKEKMEYAEKYLANFIIEHKRHFNFSDLQIIKILENSSQKIKKIKMNQLKFFILKFLR
ncbi:hypothetical protein IJG14_04070 [bacterium]|nr:hypothetical protein [bacterium]